MALKSTLPREIQRNIAIEPYRHKSDAKGLVEEARKRVRIAKQERNPFERVWLFFDNDNDVKLQEAFRIVENENKKAEIFFVAYSSICIEHWFILHFEDCGRAFATAEEAGRYLRRCWADYHKTKINHYTVLGDRIEIAMKRATMVRERREVSLPLYRCNPYTTVDLLVEFIRSVEKT